MFWFIIININSGLVWFCIFFLSSTLKKVSEHFSPSSFHLMEAPSFAPFACLFSNWWSSSCKFLIIGLISGLNFFFFFRISFVYVSHKFRNLFFSLEILIFPWVFEFLEHVLAFSLKQVLVYFHLSFADQISKDTIMWLALALLANFLWL